jgi:hypothetical protein
MAAWQFMHATRCWERLVWLSPLGNRELAHVELWQLAQKTSGYLLAPAPR